MLACSCACVVVIYDHRDDDEVDLVLVLFRVSLSFAISLKDELIFHRNSTRYLAVSLVDRAKTDHRN